MLKATHNWLQPNGFVYIELPDGESALKDGCEREEFFIEHIHIFSLTSTSMMATKANFKVEIIERLQEPSTKYTIRAILSPERKE